jgi:hypothetical protein
VCSSLPLSHAEFYRDFREFCEREKLPPPPPMPTYVGGGTSEEREQWDIMTTTRDIARGS